MLGRALAMECVSRVIFLEAAICVAGNLSAYVGRGLIPASAYKQGIGVAYCESLVRNSDKSISICLLKCNLWLTLCGVPNLAMPPELF